MHENFFLVIAKWKSDEGGVYPTARRLELCCRIPLLAYLTLNYFRIHAALRLRREIPLFQNVYTEELEARKMIQRRSHWLLCTTNKLKVMKRRVRS